MKIQWRYWLPLCQKLQYRINITNRKQKAPLPYHSIVFQEGFTQIQPVHPVQVPMCTLVHPMSTPVGLTDTLIICLAAALASIDLMKGTIEQNNKRNTTTTMPIMMPTLVNHCPQDPKSKFKPIPSMHVYSSILGHFLS